MSFRLAQIRGQGVPAARWPWSGGFREPSLYSFKAARFIDVATFHEPCVTKESDHNRRAGRSGWGS
jgi:hypothetical protein